MKCAVLFSGGKDSTYAAFIVKKQGHEISCLISIFSENPDSYMFHTPSISKVKKQSEVMKIPLIIKETIGEKEKELIDLEKAIIKAVEIYKIDSVVSGAVESVYQKSRIERICDKLGLECLNPLWKIDPINYWDELLKNNFEIILVSVSAEGFDKKWLGKKIDKELIEKLKFLNQKYKIHLSFEGGEAESFVVNCPLFSRELKIKKGEVIGKRNTWKMEIQVK